METREDLERQLSQLHKERGRALAAGGRFNNGRIVELHQRLSEFEDIENAKAEQAREQQAKAHQDAIQAARREVADATAASAKAKANADNALTEYCGLMKLRYQHSEQHRQAVAKLNALTGDKEAAPDIKQLQKQDSMLLLNQLRTISGHPSEFGYVRIPGATKSL